MTRRRQPANPTRKIKGGIVPTFSGPAWERGCRDKRPYESMSDARREAKRQMRARPRLRLWVYRCECCSLAHLTSKPPLRFRVDPTDPLDTR